MKGKIISICLSLMVFILINTGSADAFSFQFDLLGYTVSYQPQPTVEVVNNIQHEPIAPQQNYIEQTHPYEVVNPLPSGSPQQIHDYDSEIQTLNSYKQVQLALKELDYRRMGFVDTDTGQEYTVFISQEGLIEAIYAGNLESEVQISGSLSQIKERVQNGQFDALKSELQIPWSLKMKLLLTMWF
jgi:hypothetical protein